MLRHGGLGVLMALMLGLAGSLRLVQLANPSVRELQVGAAPAAMSIDPALHRALVLDNVGGQVHILDTGTGVALQTVTLGGAASIGIFPLSAAIDSRSGYAFVYTQDGTIFTLDLLRGLVLRRTTIASIPTSPNYAALAVDPSHSRLFAINYNALTLSVMDADAGRVLRAIGIGPTTTVGVDTRRGLIAISDGGAPRPTRILDERTGRDARGTSPSLCSGLNAPRSGLPSYAVNPAAGVWQRLDGPGGAILCATLPGRTADLAAMDARTGRRFFLDAQHGVVRMTGAGTGAAFRTVRVAAGPSALAVDSIHHHLLVASVGATDALGRPLDRGVLSVIDETSGRTVRTVQVGVAPMAIAVDERSGLAFVLNSNTNPDGSAAQLPGEHTRLLDRLRSILFWLPLPRPAPVHPTGSVTVLNLN
jgi:DNA-binding beta-propeller fold protein YncE